MKNKHVTIWVGYGKPDVAVSRPRWERGIISTAGYLDMQTWHIVTVDIELAILATRPTRLSPVQRAFIRIIGRVQHQLCFSTSEAHKMREAPFCGVDFGACEQNIKSKYIPIKGEGSRHIEDFDVRC